MSAASPNRLVHFLVRRRVPISIAVFGILMIADVARGIVPHDVFDWTDYRSVAGLLALIGGLVDAILGGRLSDQEHGADDRPALIVWCAIRFTWDRF